MVPHLALPTLAAHLRRMGAGVVTLDENVSFFTRYLFTPVTLEGFLDAARRLSEAPDGSQGPGWKAPSGREIAQWERAADRIEHTLSVFREMDAFLRPELAVQALDDLERLFRLCSRVHGPGDLSFDHYRRGDVDTPEDLAALAWIPPGTCSYLIFRTISFLGSSGGRPGPWASRSRATTSSSRP